MDLLTLAVIVAQAVEPAPAPSVLEAHRSGPVVTERLAPFRGEGSATTAADSLFEYSPAYYRRLSVHRAASYTILPLFAFQLAAGTQLYSRSFEAPAWARTGHRVAATGVAALFVVNTVTGIPNLLEGRKDPVDRRRKIFHAIMMLTAEAGFTATGILAERAERSADNRALHRTVALTSIGVATVGYLSMLDLFRKD